MASPAQGELRPGPAASDKIWRPFVHMWYRLFRNDIFISYTRADAGRNYAHALAIKLQDRKFEVLMDTFDATPSPYTSQALLDQMRRCMQLVIVASSGAVKSTEVAKEIELFPKKGRSIILLEFDENVRNADWYKQHLVGLSPVPTLQETPDQQRATLQSIECTEDLFDEPTKETLDLIENAFKFKRQRFRQAALATLTGAATIFFFIALAVLRGKLVDAGARFKRQTEEQARLFQQRTDEQDRRFQQRTDNQNQKFEQETEEQNRLLEQQKKRTEKAIEQTAAANSARDKAQIQLDSTAARVAANLRLDSDPVLAYRLAEYAYHLVPDTENARFLRAVASKTKFPYKQEFRNCVLAHVNAPWALLACRKEKVKTLKVLDLRNGKVEYEHQNGSSLRYRTVWVVPHEGSWRLLGEKVTHHQQYAEDDELFEIDILDASGTVQGTITDKNYLPAMCGADRLIIHRNYLNRVTLLDAHTGAITPVQGGDFVSCKPDGGFIIADGKKIYMFDSEGSKPRENKLTYQNADDKSEYYNPPAVRNSDLSYHDWNEGDQLSWSPDGRVLALWHEQRLHVLDPGTGTFTSLTPGRIADSAFTWEDGHVLIVASHTRDQTDFAIDAIDALTPSRKPIEASPGLVRDMKALPDGRRATAYDSGIVDVTRSGDGTTLWSGKHPYVTSLAVGDALLISSSGEDVRIWPINPPVSHWVFRSSDGHKYLRCAAGDPAYRWQAVAYFATGKGIVVEVRSVTSDDHKLLDLPAEVTSCNLAFSQDGRWLVAVGEGGGRVFNTQNWKPYDVPAHFQTPFNIAIGPGRMVLFHELVPPGGPEASVLVDLSGEEPQFGPMPSDGVGHLNSCISWLTSITPQDWDEIHALYLGWDSVLGASPADKTARGCHGSGWIERVLVPAYEELGDTALAIEFIPTDLRALMGMYASMMPVIPEEELRNIVRKERGNLEAK